MLYSSLVSILILILSQACFFSFQLHGQASMREFRSEKYQVDVYSKLNLIGETNVNNFSCFSSEFHENRAVIIHNENAGSELTFTLPEIKVLVPSLDCGQKGINRDMREMLRADEYPYIRIKILSAKMEQQQAWVKGETRTDIRIKTQITITDKKQVVEIPMKAIKTGEGHFSFRGNIRLRLTDFGIEPPTILLGLIEVKNEVSVAFEIKTIQL